MFTESPYSSPPELIRLPHLPGRSPDLFAFDLWHAFHLGTGKVFAASVLAFISDEMAGGRIEERFEELTSQYLQFCEANRQSPFLGQITKETLGWPDRKTFPNGQWSKGHITTSLCAFVEYWLDHANLVNKPLLRKCHEASQLINTCIRELYSNDLWIRSNEALRIASLGLRFLECFMELAATCFQQNISSFIYMPKIHIIHHIFDTMTTQAVDPNTPWVLNPLAHAVQQDEDYVGKVSRVSRRVSAPQVVRRVLERSLQASYKHWCQCGYIAS